MLHTSSTCPKYDPIVNYVFRGTSGWRMCDKVELGAQRVELIQTLSLFQLDKGLGASAEVYLAVRYKEERQGRVLHCTLKLLIPLCEFKSIAPLRCPKVTTPHTSG